MKNNLEKAFIHATKRKLKSGKVVPVKAYTDKRIAKKIVAKDKIRIPSIKNKTHKEVKEKLHNERDTLKMKLDEVRKHKQDLIEAKEKGDTHTEKGISVEHDHHIHKHEKNLHEQLEHTNHRIMLHENRYELLRDKSRSAREKAKEKRKEKKTSVTTGNTATFKDQKEYMDWYRKQSGDVKADHKLNREGGKLVATWGKKEVKPAEKPVTVAKKEKDKEYEIPKPTISAVRSIEQQKTEREKEKKSRFERLPVAVQRALNRNQFFTHVKKVGGYVDAGQGTRQQTSDANKLSEYRKTGDKKLLKEFDREYSTYALTKEDITQLKKIGELNKPKQIKTKSSLNQLFEKYYRATEKPEKANYAKLARAKYLEENPGSSMQDYLKAARDAKPEEGEKPKTDAEEKENRSKAMIGNKNAYKGGPKDEQITKKLKQELKTDPVLKGMAISIDLIKTGKAELIGRSVKNPAEMAAIAQVFRDPRYETIRYVLTKGDEINAHLAVTSKMPARSLVAPGKSGETNTIDWLTSKMKEYEADGYYLIHNHPSGDPEPSSQDVSITDKLQKNVKGYKGHIIINSNKYASLEIGKFGEVTKEIKDLNGKQDELLRPSMDHPLLGKKINSQDALAAISKDLQNTDKYFTLIGADNKLKTRTILEAPKEMLKDTPESRKAFESFLRTHTKETGANHFFVANVPNDGETRKFLTSANHHGLITDASFTNRFGTSALTNMDLKPDLSEKSFSDLPKKELTGHLTEEKRKTKSIVAKKEKNTGSRSESMRGNKNAWKGGPKDKQVELRPSKNITASSTTKAKIDDWMENGVNGFAFKSWFGDWEDNPKRSSKVVDKNGKPAENHSMSKSVDHDGKPVVIYHGTSVGGFDKFEKKNIGGWNLYGDGFYFTEDKKIAEDYTGKDSTDADKADFATGIKDASGKELEYIPKDVAQKFLDNVMFLGNEVKKGEEGYNDYLHDIHNYDHNNSDKMFSNPNWDYGLYRSIKNTMTDKGVNVNDLFNELVNPDRIDPEKSSKRDTTSKYFDKGPARKIQKKWLFNRIPELKPVIAPSEIKEVFLNIRNPYDMDLEPSDTEIKSIIDHAFKQRKGDGNPYHLKDLPGYLPQGYKYVNDRRVIDPDGMEKFKKMFTDLYDAGALQKPRVRVPNEDPNSAYEFDFKETSVKDFLAHLDSNMDEAYIGEGDILIKNPDAIRALWPHLKTAKRYELNGETGKYETTNYNVFHQTKDGKITRQGLHKILSDAGKYVGQQKFMDDWVREQGHDGLSHTGGHNIGAKDHKVWVAFEPNQIKSTKNEGTFSRKTSILHKSFN